MKADRAGIEQPDGLLVVEAMEQFGVQPEFLSKVQASGLIDQMQDGR